MADPYQTALAKFRPALTPQDQAYVNAAQGIAPGAAPVNSSPFVAPDDPNAPVGFGSTAAAPPAGVVSSPVMTRPGDSPATGPTAMTANGPTGAVQFQLKRPDVAKPLGGGGINPLTGLANDAKSTTAGYLGSMQNGRNAVESKGIVDAEVTRQNADLEAADAEKKAQMAADEKEVNDAAQAGLQTFMDQNVKMTSEIAEQKVDPQKFFKDRGAAGQVMIGIGASLGGFLQGMQGRGGPNEFMQQVNSFVDRDIAAQQGAIDNKKSALSSRQNMFGQLLSQTGDRRVAAMQLRQFQMEGMKQMLTASAARNGIPSQLADTEIKVGLLDTDIAKTKQVIAQVALDKARSEAAAALHAKQAETERAWQHGMAERKAGQEDRQLDIAAGKVNAAAKGNVAEGVATLGKAFSDPKFQANRTVIKALAAQVAKTPQGEQIEGLGLGSRIVRALPFGEHMVSDQANLNVQNVDDAGGAFATIRTGAGGSDETFKKIDKQFQGAGTAAERANAIMKLDEYIDGQELSLRAANPEASQQYDANMAALKNKMPNTVKRQ